MAGRVVPLATSEQTLAAAAAASATRARPELLAAPMNRPSIGWGTSSATSDRHPERGRANNNRREVTCGGALPLPQRTTPGRFRQSRI
jgi:hypothetical protein